MSGSEKKIFLTGASGFLGRHFLEDTAGMNFKIFALTRNKNNILTNSSLKHVEVVEGNIADIEKFNSILQHCDYFIQLAGEKKDESKMEETNVLSMKKITSLLKDISGIKLLYISSSGVYGVENLKEDVIIETNRCEPNTVYEKSKLKAENILREFSSSNSLDYIILRPSNVIGEYDNSNKLLNLMKSLKRGLFFYADKNAEVNYVYAKYLTSVMIHFIHSGKFNNEIYNVNSPMKLNELISILKSELNIKSKSITLPRWLLYPLVMLFEILPEKFQLLNSKKYFALTSHKIYSAKKLEMEFLPGDKFSLKHGLKNLINWYRKENLL